MKQAKVLSEDGGATTIKFRTLDISKTESIEEFASFLKEEHPEGIDILVNNAGIALEGFGEFSQFKGPAYSTFFLPS